MGVFNGDSIYNSRNVGGGGGGVSVDPPLSGDGTPENPIKVNENEILKSKLEFTVDLGAVVSSGFHQGNGQLFCRGSLFYVVMNHEIKPDTDLFFAISQLGSCSSLFAAIYEYDLVNGKSIWVANTSDLSALVDANTGAVGLQRTKFRHVKNNSYTLKTNKLYYFILFGNPNGIYFLGNTVQSTFNTKPYPVFYMDNMESVFNGVTPENLSSTIPEIQDAQINALGGESTQRIFAAFGNLE